MTRNLHFTCVMILLALVCLPAVHSAGTPAAAATTATVRVETGTVINTITHPFWGVNYVGFWDAVQGNPGSREALRNAGVQVIRFPGGEPANWFDWSKPDTPPYWTTTSTDELWAYARGVGAKLLLQTNPTRNEISDSGERNDPSGMHAGGWASYTRQQGIDAPYWEVGNEPDLKLTRDYDWAAMQWYYDAFNAHAAALKTANPQARVFGPAGTNAWQWWGLHSLDMFLARTGNKQGSGLADGVSLHYYAAQDCANWDTVRAAAQGWPRAMEQITSVIATYDSRPLPVFISETNAAVGGLNCEINQTMASALANADLLGAYRATGVQAVQLFGAIHGANGWGLLYGKDDARPQDTPTPTYFILPIWTKSGNQVLKMTSPSDPETTLSSYASKKPDGSLQVVLINKTGAPLDTTVEFSGYNPSGRQVAIYELKPASGGIWDKDVVYNGVRMPKVTAAALPAPKVETATGTGYRRTLPAYSLTLLDIRGSGGGVAPTPPPGVTPSPTPQPTPRPGPPPGRRKIHLALIRR